MARKVCKRCLGEFYASMDKEQTKSFEELADTFPRRHLAYPDWVFHTQRTKLCFTHERQTAATSPIYIKIGEAMGLKKEFRQQRLSEIFPDESS